MTFKEKYLLDHPGEDHFEDVIDNCCPWQYDYEPDHEYDDYCKSNGCATCWNREMSEDEPFKTAATNTINDLEEMGKRLRDMAINYTKNINPNEVLKAEHDEMTQRKPRILDSGNRREFESGAVRDIQEGKGRCDLLPLDVVSRCFPYNTLYCAIIVAIDNFQNTGDAEHLYKALEMFGEIHFENRYTMLLEVAIHFEEGAKKYGDSNWQKGIPVRCYIDSAVRHYLKFLRGDKDEPHDRAFAWNLLCAIWTCKHKPELNDYAKTNET